MYVLFFVISVLASLIGAICGIGGGIIIKPVLDAAGVLDVATIGFLSGCTVLSMSVYSVVHANIGKKSQVNFKVSTALAAGAVIGGILGKLLFGMLWIQAFNKDAVGMIQAVCLVIITIGTLVYTLFMNKIKTHRVNNLFVTAVIGMLLGLVSSFLGIGGGPINLVVLFYFFSMEIKQAAENSIYIILFSQMASLVSSIISGTIPHVDFLLLLLMVIGGILGGIIGRSLNKKIHPKTVGILFVGLMSVIIFVNLYNIFRFSSFLQ